MSIYTDFVVFGFEGDTDVTAKHVVQSGALYRPWMVEYANYTAFYWKVCVSTTAV